MISFAIGDRRFDLRAAAVIVHDGRLLLHRIPDDDYWALPGGRVEIGETGAQAVVRELREETGEHATCERLLGVVENFFTLRGREHHAVEFYFATSFAHDSPVLASPRFEGVEAGTPLLYEWFPLTDLDRIDVRPPVVRRLVAVAPPSGMLHMVQRDESAGSIALDVPRTATVQPAS